MACAELLLLEDNTWPSLVVIVQLSWLSRRKLLAETEPISEFEMGVTVIDHGMYTFGFTRVRPEPSVQVIEMRSSGALEPVTEYVICRGPAGVVVVGGGGGGGVVVVTGGGASCVVTGGGGGGTGTGGST
ncbi:hypothetical protein AN910_15050, partial [Mycobacteroides immunogenum]